MGPWVLRITLLLIIKRNSPPTTQPQTTTINKFPLSKATQDRTAPNKASSRAITSDNATRENSNSRAEFHPQISMCLMFKKIAAPTKISTTNANKVIIKN